MTELPPELIDADRSLHRLLETISFSPHLNPINIDEARRAFLAGAVAPPFEYAPAPWAEEVIQTLDAIRPPLDHPLGVELGRSTMELRSLVLALRDRTAEAFDRLNEVAGWYTSVEEPPLTLVETPTRDEPATLDADRMADVLRAALDTRGLTDWAIERDPVMSARVLVDGAKRLIRINPNARFRYLDLRTLVAHEIDVHATRARNGASQPLFMFQDGLPGSLLTEEGLAIAAEMRVAGIPTGFLARQRLFLDAVTVGRVAGFRTVFEVIASGASPGVAWGVALRVKRGLARPDEPGVYAKDTVYARGFQQVHAWLEAGNDVNRLYVGKVGLHHPVDEWVREGWLHRVEAPTLWINDRRA